MAIAVTNATHIGTAKSYDLFDILTYEAAQQFINAANNIPAGAHFTQDARTFAEHIGENMHLYFFTEVDTNRVKYAVIKARNQGYSGINIRGRGRAQIGLQVNFNLEDTNQHATIKFEDHVPLFLLPDVRIEEPITENGAYFSDDALVAVLPQFCIHDAIQLLSLPPRIHEIRDNAFQYGQEIYTLVLSDNISTLPPNVISADIRAIGVEPIQTPNSWSAGWNRGFENITEFGYGLTDEDRADLEAEIAAREAEIAAREARLAAEREEAQRLEAERIAREKALAAEREARKIRYKVVGDEITIKGTRKGVTELEIPAEIEGKPVTKIEAYAFFDNEDLRKVVVPPTLKIIERGATANMSNLQRSIRVPATCIVGKDNPNIKKI